MNNDQSNSSNNDSKSCSNTKLGTYSIASLFAAYYGYTQDSFTIEIEWIVLLAAIGIIGLIGAFIKFDR